MHKSLCGSCFTVVIVLTLFVYGLMALVDTLNLNYHPRISIYLEQDYFLLHNMKLPEKDLLKATSKDGLKLAYNFYTRESWDKGNVQMGLHPSIGKL